MNEKYKACRNILCLLTVGFLFPGFVLAQDAKTYACYEHIKDKTENIGLLVAMEGKPGTSGKPNLKDAAARLEIMPKITTENFTDQAVDLGKDDRNFYMSVIWALTDDRLDISKFVVHVRQIGLNQAGQIDTQWEPKIRLNFSDGTSAEFFTQLNALDKKYSVIEASDRNYWLSTPPNGLSANAYSNYLYEKWADTKTLNIEVIDRASNEIVLSIKDISIQFDRVAQSISSKVPVLMNKLQTGQCLPVKPQDKNKVTSQK